MGSSEGGTEKAHGSKLDKENMLLTKLKKRTEQSGPGRKGCSKWGGLTQTGGGGGSFITKVDQSRNGGNVVQQDPVSYDTEV